MFVYTYCRCIYSQNEHFKFLSRYNWGVSKNQNSIFLVFEEIRDLAILQQKKLSNRDEHFFDKLLGSCNFEIEQILMRNLRIECMIFWVSFFSIFSKLLFLSAEN